MKNRKRYTWLAAAGVLALALMVVQPAAAHTSALQEAGDEIELAGTVISIDEEAGIFVIQDDTGETHVVVPGEDFDFSTLEVDDVVEVEGLLNNDGSILAEKVDIEYPDDDPGDGTGEELGDPSEGYYCEQPDEQHPFGALLAERYATDYAALQGWFCDDGFGWGQVMLALVTSSLTDVEPGELLAARSADTGWGEIWQELKLIGRPEDAGPPNDEDGDGKPDFAGPPNDEDGDGKPDFAGPPNDEDGDGIPDHAGPPNDEDGDGIPDHAGPPNDEDGDGKPDHAAPPSRR